MLTGDHSARHAPMNHLSFLHSICANKIMVSAAAMSIPVGNYHHQGVIINVERHVWITKLEK
jgi:hypothetical protein